MQAFQKAASKRPPVAQHADDVNVDSNDDDGDIYMYRTVDCVCIW